MLDSTFLLSYFFSVIPVYFWVEEICSQKQLDMLLNELDADGSGTIEYESVFIFYVSCVFYLQSPQYKHVCYYFIFNSELMGGSAMVKKE